MTEQDEKIIAAWMSILPLAEEPDHEAALRKAHAIIEEALAPEPTGPIQFKVGDTICVRSNTMVTFAGEVVTTYESHVTLVDTPSLGYIDHLRNDHFVGRSDLSPFTSARGFELV